MFTKDTRGCFEKTFAL